MNSPEASDSSSSKADTRSYRERAPRTMTLLMTGKLMLDDREGLCRVRNISTTGMKIETRAALAVDQRVRIGMRYGEEIEARVAWTRDGAAGLQFLTPIDVEAMLGPQPRQSRISRQRAPRAPRLAANCPIKVEARGAMYDAMLLDISQGGAKLRLPFRPMRDERLAMTIPGLSLKSGGVRWIGEEEVGLGFYVALSFDVLAAWVEERNAPASTDELVPGPRTGTVISP
ncbi:PilZ domain-containing protein [Novosphingobium sp. M1R2S20]|uniref:PilZ domain-containing protein n=1 Tax=Novosphingobium rhizovicinum TaxID=3228928 RepID=A0ABV3R9A3_9SPHN